MPPTLFKNDRVKNTHLRSTNIVMGVISTSYQSPTQPCAPFASKINSFMRQLIINISQKVLREIKGSSEPDPAAVYPMSFFYSNI
jgi:hypothetical protein